MISASVPGRDVMTKTRSDRNMDSAIEWVTKTTVLRLPTPDPQHFEVQLFARHRIERTERLVHQ